MRRQTGAVRAPAAFWKLARRLLFKTAEPEINDWRNGNGTDRRAGQSNPSGRALLEGMRKVIAERMTFSKHEYPQGTGQVHLEVSRVMQFRKELLEQKGIKVSFGDLYVKAAACALEENMALNASPAERADHLLRGYQHQRVGLLQRRADGARTGTCGPQRYRGGSPPS